MRKFTEQDVFSPDFAGADARSRLIFSHLAAGRCFERKAPLFIDKPFSEQFGRDHGAAQKLPCVDEFCAEVKEAVLLGERAVVTPAGGLITDDRARPPSRMIFPQWARDFEFMRDAGEENGAFSTPRVDEPELELKGSVVLLSSWEHWNYGAMLLRVIPKLLTLRALGLADLPVLAPPGDWHRNVLAAFGVKEMIPHSREKSYGVDQLYVPSQKTNAFFYGDDVRALMGETAEVHADQALGDHPLVYVSRLSVGRNNPRYRQCRNEEALIERLEALGFLIFEPERHAIERQMATFRKARFVVGPSGAGMFNVVFCRPGTRVLAIEPLPVWFWQHCNLYAAGGHDYGFVCGGAIEDDPEPVQKPWIADIDAVLTRVTEGLRALGL